GDARRRRAGVERAERGACDAGGGRAFPLPLCLDARRGAPGRNRRRPRLRNDRDGSLMGGRYLSMLRLIETIAHGLVDGQGEGIEEAFARLAAQDFSESAYRAPEPRLLPACRYLPEAVASTMMLDSTLAAGLAEVEDSLSWRQNPNYSDAAMGQ